MRSRGRCRCDLQPDSKPGTEGQRSHQQVGDQTSLHELTLFFAASEKQLRQAGVRWHP
jgi:hypothetical protein